MKQLLTTALFLGVTSAGAATVTLLPGQSGMLGDTRVMLLRMTDSRCPMDAMCIQMGELTASLFVTKDNKTTFLKLEMADKRNTNEPPPVNDAGVYIQSAPARKADDRRPVPITFTDERS